VSSIERSELEPSIDKNQQQDGDLDYVSTQLKGLAEYLNGCRQRRSTVTYLQAADAINIAPPQRIHQVTQLLEALVDYDHQHGQPLRAALVVSRYRIPLPAEGFFMKVRTLGLVQDLSNEEFHQYCLHRLFDKALAED
jgi:hypothetical protein